MFQLHGAYSQFGLGSSRLLVNTTHFPSGEIFGISSAAPFEVNWRSWPRESLTTTSHSVGVRGNPIRKASFLPSAEIDGHCSMRSGVSTSLVRPVPSGRML